MPIGFVFLILVCIPSSQATLYNIQKERGCVYESLELFTRYRDMKCPKNDEVKQFNFSTSCEDFCAVNIGNCEEDDKLSGATLKIISLNISIESYADKKELATISCNFSSLTYQENCIQDPVKYTTTHTIPQTSYLTDPLITQETQIIQFTSKIGFTLENIIGAVIGGALFGTITTAIVAIFIYRKSSIFQTNKLQFDPVRNPLFQQDGVQLAENSNQTDRQSIVYNEVNDDMGQTNSNDKDVYNHLHESDKEDRSGYYDHAGPTPSLSIMEDGYGSVLVEPQGNSNYSELDRALNSGFGKTSTVGNERNTNYSTLEANK